MGEIADDMIDGTCCSDCGMYFDGGGDKLYTHGYPVLCWDCWIDIGKRARIEAEASGLQRALVKTLG